MSVFSHENEGIMELKKRRKTGKARQKETEGKCVRHSDSERKLRN